MQNQQYNETLTPLWNISFAANHLLQVSLVQRVPAPNLNKPDLKEKVFGFVTLAPGDGAGNSRTYNFQNKVTQKFQLREIESLSFVLRQLAIGNQNVLPYTKFTRSQQGQKMLSVWVASKIQQMGQQQVNVKTINVTIDAGGAKSTLNMSPDQAYGFGSYLNELFKNGVSKEFDLQSQQPGYVKGSSGPAQSLPTQQNQGGFQGQPNQASGFQQQPTMQPNGFQQPFQGQQPQPVTQANVMQPNTQPQPAVQTNVIQPNQSSVKQVNELKTEFQDMF
jgi:hypothetical protein